MLVLKRQNTPPSLLKKTQGIVDHFEELFAQTRKAFQQERVFQRAGTLAISSLVALGRRTVSGMLCASAQQFQDWTAAYRLFAPSAVKPKKKDGPERRAEYRREQEERKVSAVAAVRLAQLQQEVDDKKIICSLDGAFTNQTVFRSLPENCTLTGRIRKDARLFLPPDETEQVRLALLLTRIFCRLEVK